jgi:hypothetical protein
VFRDRLGEEVVAALPATVEHGRYVALVETVAGSVRIPPGRHVTGVPGCVLQAPHAVELVGTPVPDGETAEKLVQLATLKRFDEPAREYPLVGQMSRGVTLSRAELMLQEHANMLRDVCRRPNTRLVSVEDVVWLSRVKRLASGGEAWIDDHPEQWMGWQRGLPVPAMAPATVYSSDFDVYENRVTARLIDRRLMPKLTERIAALRGKRPAIEQFETSVHAHHLLHSRLGKLWNQWSVGNVAKLHEQIDQTLGALEVLLAKSRRLRSTPLYRGLPRDASVPPVLRRTNVLRGDARYRRIGELWDAFRGEVPAGPQERALKAEQLAVGHARFVRVLVARALHELAWDRDGAAAHVVVEDRGDGNLLLHAADAPPLRVVPLLFAGSCTELACRIAAPPDTLIVHARAEGRPAPGQAELIGATWFVATSPLDIMAVEAVGYAIHNHVLRARLGALPAEVELPERLAGLATRLGLTEPRSRAGGARYVLPRPLAKLDEVLEDERMQSVGRGREARLFARDLDVAAPRLRDANARLWRALVCPHPVCLGKGRVASHSRERYVIACTSWCGSRWGVQSCSKCSRALPFLALPEMPERLVEAAAHHVTSTQAVFGMLAIGELAPVEEDLGVRCSCGHVQPVSVQRKSR